MNTNLQSQPASLYEADFLKWIETTVAHLRAQEYTQVDWENVIEEIESMGRSERSSFRSNLIILLLHLLKWQYQPDMRSGSWRGSIVEHRQRLQEALEDSPSLKPYLEQVFESCYAKAIDRASAETGLPATTFPEVCPYPIADVLATTFLPEV